MANLKRAEEGLTHNHFCQSTKLSQRTKAAPTVPHLSLICSGAVSVFCSVMIIPCHSRFGSKVKTKIHKSRCDSCKRDSRNDHSRRFKWRVLPPQPRLRARAPANFLHACVFRRWAKSVAIWGPPVALYTYTHPRAKVRAYARYVSVSKIDCGLPVYTFSTSLVDVSPRIPRVRSLARDVTSSRCCFCGRLLFLSPSLARASFAVSLSLSRTRGPQPFYATYSHTIVSYILYSVYIALYHSYCVRATAQQKPPSARRLYLFVN